MLSIVMGTTLLNTTVSIYEEIIETLTNKKIYEVSNENILEIFFDIKRIAVNKYVDSGFSEEAALQFVINDINIMIKQ